jgi:hypothetical protein
MPILSDSNHCGQLLVDFLFIFAWNLLYLISEISSISVIRDYHYHTHFFGRIPHIQCVLDATLCDKVCQLLTTGPWFSLVSSINKDGLHDITEIQMFSFRIMYQV